MQPRSFALTLILCLIAVAGAANAQQKARSEALDMEDKDRALVAKESVKQKRDSKAMASKSGGGPNSQCGSVDIGNDNNKKGSSQIAERQKTVIITGNVINTANCK